MPTAAINTLTSGNGFLTSFNTTTPKLYLTAETDSVADFDQVTLQKWQAEGFDISYLPYGSGGPAYTRTLQSLSRNMSVGQSYGIVAYGDAATACLETFRKSTSHLRALVAYYPGAVPDVHTSFPIGLKVLVHLAGAEVGVTRNAEVLGIQGKRKTTRKSVPQGLGTGGLLKLAWPAYAYEGVEPGFAEHDLEEYNRIAEGVAWARSLDCIRKAFGAEVDLERNWEEHINYGFVTKNDDKLMTTLTEKPYINHVPTMTGGIGRPELHRFYRDFFIPDNPPSLKIKLISRTIGVDKIVDELFISFDHTQEISWMLPGVPATNKHVNIILVFVVTMRGGKLYKENVYWDQASVLVQLGLIDPSYIPPKMRNLDIDQLPVTGAESALKVLDPYCEPSNEMMDDW